jgi:hypothetical protein
MPDSETIILQQLSLIEEEMKDIHSRCVAEFRTPYKHERTRKSELQCLKEMLEDLLSMI